MLESPLFNEDFQKSIFCFPKASTSPLSSIIATTTEDILAWRTSLFEYQSTELFDDSVTCPPRKVTLVDFDINSRFVIYHSFSIHYMLLRKKDREEGKRKQRRKEKEEKKKENKKRATAKAKAVY